MTGLLTFGERVLIERRRRTLTQKALARRANLPQRELMRIETGKTKNPHLERVKALAEALGVSVDYLLGVDSQDEA